MSENVTALSKIYIGAEFNGVAALGDFEAQTWTEIGDVTNLGTWGAKAKEITTVILSDPYTRRLKGSIDNGTVQLAVNRDPFDDGQSAVKVAAASFSTFLFKVELADSPNDTGTDTLFYFRASVMSADNKFDGADTIIETTFGLGITGQILEVPATVTIAFAPVAGALPVATHAVPYTETIAATGGVGTVTYEVTTGTLPSPLALNAASGMITGTPAAAGTSDFSITATFADAGEAVAAYSIVVG